MHPTTYAIWLCYLHRVGIGAQETGTKNADILATVLLWIISGLSPLTKESRVFYQHPSNYNKLTWKKGNISEPSVFVRRHYTNHCKVLLILLSKYPQVLEVQKSPISITQLHFYVKPLPQLSLNKEILVYSSFSVIRVSQ